MFLPVAGPSRLPDAPPPSKYPRLTQEQDTDDDMMDEGMVGSAGLKALPDDILLLIIGLIDVEDIIALRLVSGPLM